MGRFVLATILMAGVVGGFGSAIASWHHGGGHGHCHKHVEE
jgi:hypothetical protein